MPRFKSEFLNDIDSRGMLYQTTNIDGLDDYITGGNAVAYWGTDPTADALHVGHLASFSIMRKFAQYGGKPIILVGGATGMIGDNDNATERPLLSEEVLQKNVDGIKRDLSNFFDFKNGALLVNNYDWFKGVGYIEFLRNFGRHFSVNDMLKKESVKIRLDRGLPMSFLEFNYSLLQAYDFMHLFDSENCRIQLCGADQWGNSIAGVSLIRRLRQTEAFVLSNPLITDSKGEKFGKSAGNAVWLNPERTSHFDYYQYFRNVQDADVGKLLRVFTDLPVDEISKLEKLKDAEINEAKKILAFEATKICRGVDAANGAAAAAASLFGSGQAAEIPTVSVKAALPMSVLDFAMIAGLFASKSEARRMIEQGGLSIDNVRVAVDTVINQADEFLVQKGKKVFVKLKIES